MALPLVKILCLCMIPCFILALIGTVLSGFHLYDGCQPLNCTYSSSNVNINNETIYENCTVIATSMNSTKIITSCSWIVDVCPISDISVACFGKQTIDDNTTSIDT